MLLYGWAGLFGDRSLTSVSPIKWLKAYRLRNYVGYNLWCFLEGDEVAYEVFPSWWKPGTVLEVDMESLINIVPTFNPELAIVVPLNGNKGCRVWVSGRYWHAPLSNRGWWFYPCVEGSSKLNVYSEPVTFEINVCDVSGSRINGLSIESALKFLVRQLHAQQSCLNTDSGQIVMLRQAIVGMMRQIDELKAALEVEHTLSELRLQNMERVEGERDEALRVIHGAIRAIKFTQRYVHSRQGAEIRVLLTKALLELLSANDPRRQDLEAELEGASPIAPPTVSPESPTIT